MPMILKVAPVDPDYRLLAEALLAEPLATEWREDAESWHEDGISYVVAYVPDPANGMQFVPAAWAGYRVESIDGRTVLRCCNNYVRRDCRDRSVDLYALAYRARHREVLVPSGLPGWTVLYPQPIPLHEADGWTRATGPDAFGTSTGDGGDVHHWQVLTWTPSQ